MTTFTEIERTCAICGTVSRHMVHPSSNSSDSELDGSPVGMARDCNWGAPLCCPHCGYCSPSLEVFYEGVAELVASPGYQSLLADGDAPEVARQAFCAAAVLTLSGYQWPAFNMYLMAAWNCDDAGLDAESRLAREMAISAAVAASTEGRNVSSDEVEVGIVVADLCRRVGQFEEAANISAQVLETLRTDRPDDWRMPVAEMQAALIAGEDDQAHTYGEASPECRYPWIFANGSGTPVRNIDEANDGGRR